MSCKFGPLRRELPTLAEWRAVVDGEITPVGYKRDRYGNIRRGDWCQTCGEQFWPLDPRLDEIHAPDIWKGLSRECRYGRQCLRFYSVAEHAVSVSLLVAPEFAREGLLHDCSEAYTGDMIRPMKHTPEMIEFRRMEDRIERAVYERFGVIRTPESIAAVKAAEISQLMRYPAMYLERHAEKEPFGIQIQALGPEEAEELFVARFVELFPEHVDAARNMVEMLS
jgi:hypothetical protein